MMSAVSNKGHARFADVHKLELGSNILIVIEETFKRHRQPHSQEVQQLRNLEDASIVQEIVQLPSPCDNIILNILFGSLV